MHHHAGKKELKYNLNLFLFKKLSQKYMKIIGVISALLIVAVVLGLIPVYMGEFY